MRMVKAAHRQAAGKSPSVARAWRSHSVIARAIEFEKKKKKPRQETGGVSATKLRNGLLIWSKWDHE